MSMGDSSASALKAFSKTATAQEEKQSAQPPGDAARLKSLDAFRGFTMF